MGNNWNPVFYVLKDRNYNKSKIRILIISSSSLLVLVRQAVQIIQLKETPSRDGFFPFHH
jgi:hypothetical protein